MKEYYQLKIGDTSTNGQVKIIIKLLLLFLCIKIWHLK